MKLFLFLSVLNFSLAGWAASLSDLKIDKMKCGKKAIETIQGWKAQDLWFGRPNENLKEKTHQAPTDTIGKWVQLKIRENGQIELSQFTETNTVKMTFDPDCKSAAELSERVSEFPFLNGKTKSPFKIFRDKDLNELLNSKKPSVIFLWSPHTQISVEALREMAVATKKAEVRPIFVVEPTSTESSIEQVIKKLKIPAEQVYLFDSFDLTLRGLRTHFPSLIMINRGKFSSPVRRGHETAQVYEEFLKNHL